MARAKKARCPECEESFEVESDLDIGDTTVCPGCYAELKIVDAEPLMLKAVEIENSEEDDYDDAEDSEEDAVESDEDELEEY